MKVCTFKEFAALPAGTIFSYWDPTSEGLYRKGDTIEDGDGDVADYFEGALHPTPAHDSTTAPPGFYPIESRWGAYQFDQLYAVYEADDLEWLEKIIHTAPRA